jgi:hypothetical protein
MAKSLLAGKLNRDKVQTQALTAEQIEAMHQAMTAAPEAAAAPAIAEVKPAAIIVETPKIEPVQKVTITKNTEKPKAVAKEIVAQEPVNEVITRLSIDVNKDMHKAMKMRVIETEQSIRDYVVVKYGIDKELGTI